MSWSIELFFLIVYSEKIMPARVSIKTHANNLELWGRHFRKDECVSLVPQTSLSWRPWPDSDIPLFVNNIRCLIHRCNLRLFYAAVVFSGHRTTQKLLSVISHHVLCVWGVSAPSVCTAAHEDTANAEGGFHLTVTNTDIQTWLFSGDSPAFSSRTTNHFLPSLQD